MTSRVDGLPGEVEPTLAAENLDESRIEHRREAAARECGTDSIYLRGYRSLNQ